MDTNKPYLLLAFSSTLPPDDRQLTLTFHDFKGNLGKYNKEKIEILLSGSADGNKKAPVLLGHKMPSMNSDFTIEITDYKLVSKEKANISGRFYGTLRGTLGSKPCKIENGVFTNLNIKVFNESY